MPPVDLTDDERQALINLLTVEIEASKFPLSPRIEQLKADQGEAARRGASAGGAATIARGADAQPRPHKVEPRRGEGRGSGLS